MERTTDCYDNQAVTPEAASSATAPEPAPSLECAATTEQTPSLECAAQPTSPHRGADQRSSRPRPDASAEDAPRQKALSASRANDFMQCPLLFRLRVIDQVPEPHSAAAKRGTLVHAVLERLFDAPRGERSHALATQLLPGEWQRMLADDDTLLTLFEPDGDAAGVAETEWLDHANRLLGRYFTLEDPNRLEPAHREAWVRHELDNGLQLRGIIDRIDIAPDGRIRVVDYKTGRSPRPGYEAKALFQMQFYALLIWRERGAVPTVLQLLYLGDGQVLQATPNLTQLTQAEAKVRAIWDEIEDCATTGNFAPRRSRLCDWCRFHPYCPAFDGRQPAFDAEHAARRLGL